MTEYFVFNGKTYGVRTIVKFRDSDGVIRKGTVTGFVDGTSSTDALVILSSFNEEHTKLKVCCEKLKAFEKWGVIEVLGVDPVSSEPAEKKTTSVPLHNRSNNIYTPSAQQTTATKTSPNAKQTAGKEKANGTDTKWGIIGVVIAVAVLLLLFKGCLGGGADGVCDHAGCSREATCTFGDMELCTGHYYEWSNRAYKNNHKND